jgi:hypothetical protein
MGGSVQAYDTLFHASESEAHLRWETSTGVAPTRLTHQRQSDAVQGIDTTIEAARAWLLAE